jgi:4-amino-4-deoxy-L-arabinose transferase-like glycosyltransferase
MSKPPALTWSVVLISLCTGGLSLFSLYLPSALATLGVSLVILHAGREYFGERAGCLAALMYLLSFVTDGQLTTARYDGLFALPVLVGGLAAYQGWKTGRGWFVFWLAMTAGMLVKGPLIFVLSLVGLVTCLLERDAGQLFRWRREHAAGVAVLLVVFGGWLAPVLMHHRDEFAEKMLERELVAHIVNVGGKHYPFERVWAAPLSVLRDFLPWSLFGVLALVKALRRGPKSDTRSFERFLACWFVVGLILFAVAAHQRGRLTWPLIPALALLAGRQLDSELKQVSDRTIFRWATAITILVIFVSTVYHEVLLKYSTRCQQTLAMRTLAGTLRNALGKDPPVTYVDGPFAVQFYLGYLRFNSSVTNAANLLNGTNAAYVLVGDRGAPRVLGAVTNPVFTLYAWPTNDKPVVQLLSNQPVLPSQ